jgi:hypothetical protein
MADTVKILWNGFLLGVVLTIFWFSRRRELADIPRRFRAWWAERPWKQSD